MKNGKFRSLFMVSFLFLVIVSLTVVPQLLAGQCDHKEHWCHQRITTPKEFFGHDPGEDYFLANYTE